MIKESTNILFISHERKMGGANKCMFELAVELKNRGWNVHISVLYKGCPLDKACEQVRIPTVAAFYGWWCEPNEWGIVLKTAFHALHSLQGFAERKLINYIKDNNINIVHTNSLTTDIGAKVAKKAGVHHVWHFREYGKLDYNLDFFPSREKCLKYVSENSDIVIFMSEGLRKEYPEIYKSPCKTEVVYDGILNIPKWESVSKENRSYKATNASNDIDKSHTFTFLISGNIIPGKNQRLVLEATKLLYDKALVSAKYVNENQSKSAEQLCDNRLSAKKFQVLMAGTTTDLKLSKEYEASLLASIKEYKLEDVVKLIGYIKDMPSLRQTVDAEIMASRSEAYGRVTIEAMAAGNTIIASASGANPELVGGEIGQEDIEFTDRGILFRDNDAVALSQAMEWIMIHPIEKQQMECNAHAYVSTVHRNDLGVDHIERIYSKL